MISGHDNASSPRKLVEVLRKRQTEVWLVSGGFDQVIVPEAAKCGIPASNVIANHILFDEHGTVTILFYVS